MRVAKHAFIHVREFGPGVLAAMIGIAASVIPAFLIIQADNQDAERQFRVLAENHFMVLQNGLNDYVNRLKAVRALFDSSVEPVTRNEFEAFTRPLLSENAAFATLSWVPRIADLERAEHERMGVREGLPDYHIKDTGLDGKMTVSPERSEYYPIFYATVPITSALYGLDLRSETETLSELERARDQDCLGFSPVPTLVSTGGTQGGFLFSLPIYKRGSVHDSIESRRRNLVGFVHGSLITAKMVDLTMADNKTPSDLDLLFFATGGDSQSMPFYVHPSRLRTSPLALMSHAAAMAGVSWSQDLTVDGQRWLTMVARPMPGGTGTANHERAWTVLILGLIITAAVVAYIRASRLNASRMMQVNQKVSDLAQTDGLTSLANRRAFMERLGEAFASYERRGAPFAVLYFDIDYFKDVNDTLGHAAGDTLLRELAGRLIEAVRVTDIVARLGGDEFAILQTNVRDLAAAGTLAAKIGELVRVPFVINGNQVHVSCSIGISRYKPDVAGPDAMMIQADLALYRAKEDGRNCFRFHSADLDHEVKERVVLADELRGAIGRNEVELVYQPEVELRTGRIIGLEALLRWNHPKRGQISPSVFIPIAERSGQIQTIGQWVLDAACRQLRSWQEAGVAPRLVGVNISALHFKGSAELDREVAACLEKWDIAPEMIEIELTESVLMEITQQHNDRFERLRQLGVRIAIDDFGTGYSSLSYLANYPINRVKIAQELVFRVDTEPRSAAVVRAAIRLADELGIDLISEGVENEGQEAFLLSAGCEYGQGYYFSRPVNAKRATELLRLGKVEPPRKTLRLVESSAA
ncbi:MAG: EAL domain-containing protein [Xanthobacteraceae bacterium]